jgi:hypothetical protein
MVYFVDVFEKTAVKCVLAVGGSMDVLCLKVFEDCGMEREVIKGGETKGGLCGGVVSDPSEYRCDANCCAKVHYNW